MPKELFCLLCGCFLYATTAHARLPANERSAYIQSFFTHCHAQQIADPVNQDMLARRLLTDTQLRAFCQCGAAHSAEALDTKTVEAFARNQDRRAMLDIISQANQFCRNARLTVSR